MTSSILASQASVNYTNSMIKGAFNLRNHNNIFASNKMLVTRDLSDRPISTYADIDELLLTDVAFVGGRKTTNATRSSSSSVGIVRMVLVVEGKITLSTKECTLNASKWFFFVLYKWAVHLCLLSCKWMNRGNKTSW